MDSFKERVQREFEIWKEKYDIPYNMEFQVMALVRLQEEYKETLIGSNTTRTRETLLSMINNIHKSLHLKEKETENIKKTVPIYIDFSRVQVDLKEKISGVKNVSMGICTGKIIIYIGNAIFTLDKNNLIRDYAFEIKNIINTYEEMSGLKVIAYVDTYSFGKVLFDELSNCGVLVEELKRKPL